jgi:hypothetical protein
MHLLKKTRRLQINLDRFRKFIYIQLMTCMNLLTLTLALMAARHRQAVAEGGFY